MDQPIKQNNFTLIKGGYDGYSDREERKFVSAYVTDTRLMGVVGLYIHWESADAVLQDSQHQFFYFDAEEFGMENYQSLHDDDEDALRVLEKTMIGGLGGKHVPLTEKECRFLVQDFVSDTKKMHQPLPEGFDEYRFLLEPSVVLTSEELALVNHKLCPPIVNNFQLVHYFLMRAFGKDPKGLSLLLAPYAHIEEVSEPLPATLCKNTIEPFTDQHGRISYLSESLLETNSGYKLIVTELTIVGDQVYSAHRQSAFPVTVAEVSMLVSRPEFVTIFEIISDPEEFDLDFAVFGAGFMMSSHENGRLFMEFNLTNDHVHQQVFRLNDDIHGMYYVTDFGQLVVGAYSLNAIREVEKGLQKSPLNALILPTAKYEFKESVLYDFIQSDFEDFDDFLDSLQVDD